MNVRGTENSTSAIAEKIKPEIYFLKINSYYFNNINYSIVVE